MAPNAPLLDRSVVLVGEVAMPRNGAPMFVVYRRAMGRWHRIKAYGAKRIARAFPVVVSEGNAAPTGAETEVDWTARALAAEADNAALVDVLKELADLMNGVRNGSYTPDSFTLQPAERVLSSRHPGAALLEEMEGLRRRDALLTNAAVASGPIALELMSLRKQVAEARDSALEEAARKADKEASFSESGRHQAAMYGQREVVAGYKGRIVAAEGIGKSIRALRGKKP